MSELAEHAMKMRYEKDESNAEAEQAKLLLIERHEADVVLSNERASQFVELMESNDIKDVDVYILGKNTPQEQLIGHGWVLRLPGPDREDRSGDFVPGLVLLKDLRVFKWYGVDSEDIHLGTVYDIHNPTDIRESNKIFAYEKGLNILGNALITYGLTDNK